MKLQFKASLIAVLALCASNARADGGSVNLKEELANLKDKVAKLEAQLSKNDQAASASTPVKSLVDGVQVSGTVDTVYSYNFNRPSEHTNVGRVFDHDSNSMTLNAAKLTVQKAASSDSPVGFRTDILAGNDAEIIHSAGLGDGSNDFDLEQAYAEMNLGTSKLSKGMNDINLKVGKFVTLAGAEVIESKDNWNTSRGLLFGYAIPFTHTGARATYTFDNGWDMALGVDNGWDQTDDSNTSKTIEAHLGLNGIKLPSESELNWTVQGYFGREPLGDTSGQRQLVDTVLTYKTPWKPLTLIYNFDYGHQSDAAADGSAAKWYGHAGYARIDLNDDWSVIGRGEYFNDPDGVRLVSGTEAKYYEFTGTLEYRPWKGVITRFEYRHDHADEAVFNGKNSDTRDTQNTLSGEVIYSF